MNKFDYSCFYTKSEPCGEYAPADGFDTLTIREYKKGDYIAIKGDPVSALSIVVEGSIIVEFVVDSGLVVRSVTHVAPTLIGAMGILTTEGVYIADTVAAEDVKVLSYSRQQVEQQMQRDAKFMRNFITFVTSRVEALSSHIAILAQRSIKAKVAYYIFISSSGTRYRFARRIGSLAEHLCVTRPSLSRAISQMVEDGLISYDGGEGEILDARALQELLR